ncbi:MAG: hypothetical protein MJ151_03620, partial [Lachnospiraceae bacterium]|nr:hypothetical protein [Lachnospiraceae bacterium]
TSVYDLAIIAKECMKNEKLLEYVSSLEKTMAGEGRVLLRASGTEDLIRVMAEYKDKKKCEEYVDKIIDKINEYEKA